MNFVSPSIAHAKRHGILISPRQAAAVALLAGPIGCIHYLRMNYLAIGERALARNAVLFGALFLLAWNVVLALDLTVLRPTSIALSFILKVTPLLLRT